MEEINLKTEELEKIKSLISAFNKTTTTEKTTRRERAKIYFVTSFLDELYENQESWTLTCQHANAHLFSHLNKEIREHLEKRNEYPTDSLLIVCLKIYWEYYIFYAAEGEKLDIELSNIANLILKNVDNQFDDIKEKLEFIKEILPILILREFPISNAQRKIKKEYQILYEKMESANERLESKEKLVKALANNFDKISDDYNFVGLHRGFSRMFIEKQREKKLSTINVIFFGFLVFLIACAAIVIPNFLIETNESGSDSFIRLLPYLGTEIVCLYFFRLAYVEHKSIKNQILQIKLRMTLCQFIQRYASYAKDLGESKSSLEKFENIIFSGIVSDPEKIPSTFDGLEQIVGLLGKVQKVSKK